jgi:predicted HTH domain antitoxin
MQMAGIKEIKANPGLISKTIEDHQYLLISKRGKPIAIATALDDEVFDVGLKKWILIQAFKRGDLSLGQLSRSLDKSYSETAKLLNLLKIPLLDYDLEDEMDVVDSLS